MKSILATITILAFVSIDPAGCNKGGPKVEVSAQNPPPPQSRTPVQITLGDEDQLFTFTGPSTLTFNLTQTSTPQNYWVIFKKKTPCTTTAMVLPGTPAVAAHCDADSVSKHEVIYHYSYTVDAAPSPGSPLPDSGFILDSIVRCFPC